MYTAESGRDNRSFNDLYAVIRPYLVRKAACIVQNKIEAEDLVTDVFMAWLRKPVSFPTINDAKQYFYCCVRNASLNWIRQNRKTQRFKEDFRLFIGDDKENYFLPQYTRKELHAELNAAIECISPRSKTVCKLIFYEGLSLNETAHRMNLSKNTVKNQRTTAINFLRKRVSAYGM